MSNCHCVECQPEQELDAIDIMNESELRKELRGAISLIYEKDQQIGRLENHVNELQVGLRDGHRPPTIGRVLMKKPHFDQQLMILNIENHLDHLVVIVSEG